MLWAICTLLHHVAPAPLNYSSSNTKTTEKGKWQNVQWKKKKRFLVLTQEPRKSCYPTGSEHTIVGATVAGKSARAVTPILNGPQLQFQFPERRNISPLPACDFHADFWWTGGFFSSVAIYINTGHYYCKSGQTALEREPERFGCSRRFRDTLRRNLWFRLAADVAYSV